MEIIESKENKLIKSLKKLDDVHRRDDHGIGDEDRVEVEPNLALREEGGLSGGQGTPPVVRGVEGGDVHPLHLRAGRKASSAVLPSGSLQDGEQVGEHRLPVADAKEVDEGVQGLRNEGPVSARNDDGREFTF